MLRRASGFWEGRPHTLSTRLVITLDIGLDHLPEVVSVRSVISNLLLLSVSLSIFFAYMVSVFLILEFKLRSQRRIY